MGEKNKLKNIFEIEPNNELFGKISYQISKEKAYILRRNKILSYISAGSSFMALIPMFIYTLIKLGQSGFYTYFSLMFSDISSLSIYWKELSITLVESLPVLSVLLLLSVFFVFLVSLMIISKNKVQINKLKYV